MITRITRFAFAGTLCAIAAVAAFGQPASASAGVTDYNGRWSVSIVTEKGECDRGYRYGVVINNGKLAYAGEASFNVSGQVASNGAITVNVSKGDKSASGKGRLVGNSGSGRWTGGPCSGTWTAEKRS